jgi:senataxin
MKRKAPGETNSSSTAPGNPDDSHQPQKRPSLKRPGHAQTSAAALIAAARAKAQQSKVNTIEKISVKKPPPAAAGAVKDHLEKKPSPRVTRKALPPAQVSSLLTGGSLSKLVQSASKNIDENNDFSQSLPVHQPDDFWKNLREWDLPSQYYYHIQQQNVKDDPSSLDCQTNHTNSVRPLPNTFLNSRHYVAAWAPLCLAECRSQLLQEVLANIPDPVLVEVKSTTSRIKHRNHFGTGPDAPWMEENETGGNVIVYPKQRENLTFMSNDLVLLLQPQYKDILQHISNGTAVPVDGTDPEGMHAMAGISLIGHTESTRRELNGLILKVSKRKWAKIGKNEMYLIKIGSNVTALREFTALCGFDTLPMKHFLLGKHLEKAENRRKLSRHQPIPQLLQQMGGDQLGDGFLKYAEKKFNRSQLTAIAASAHEYGEGGFTLIKGPPGE